MKLSDFDYELPEELIAQAPLTERDKARLLVFQNSKIIHSVFKELPSFLSKDDCLVINDSKVIHCRIFGKRPSGGKTEIFLLKRIDDLRWEALLQPLKKIKPDTEIKILQDLYCVLEKPKRFDVPNIVRFNRSVDFDTLSKIGHIPLPPYIKRSYSSIDEENKDRIYYQTVYAKKEGSVASPTAGLHFTEELLSKIQNMGVKIARVTLDISWATFKPVKTENIEEHKMHKEHYILDEENADIIRSTKGRIIAVGTTSCRVLEAINRKFNEIRPDEDETDIFLRPGNPPVVIDGLITNFHLPRSTLLMLVASFIGYNETLNIYNIAVKERYRFYSYGDAMLLLKS